MSKSEKAIKSFFTIVFFTLGSKILGIFREVLIASNFGSGSDTDILFIAMTAVTLFVPLLTQVINTTVIPILSDADSNDGKVAKQYQTNIIINFTIITSIVLMLLGVIFAPQIVRILAIGFNPGQVNKAVTLTRIGMVSIVFAGILGVFRSYLQSMYKFTESAISLLPYNIVFIVYLIFLSNLFELKGLMVVSVIAVISQILLQLPSLFKSGYKYKFVLNFKHDSIKKISRLTPPILLSTAINDLNKIVDKTLASTLVDGSISALNYANRLNKIILELFINAIVTILFPTLSSTSSLQKYNELKKIIVMGVNTIFIITIPSTIGMIVLAEPIVSVMYERGSFDTNATSMTASALVFYSIGLSGMAQRIFLNKVFFSLKNTRIPMVNGMISVFLNIIFNLIFINFLGHTGLALATSIAALFTSLFLLAKINSVLNGIDLTKILISGAKVLLASIIMGFTLEICFVLLQDKTPQLIAILFSIVIGGVIYLLIIHLLKINELIWIYEKVRKKV